MSFQQRGTKGRRRRRRVPCSPLVVTLGMAMTLATDAAAANTLNVDRNHAACSDAGTGTSAEPYCTIGAAAADSAAGDLVLVASGTYHEEVAVRSGATGNPVTYRAAPGATVTVTGDRYGFYASNRSWVTIEGFTVTGTTGDGFHVSSGSHHVELLGNEVSHAGQPEAGLTAKGIAVSDASDVLVQDNRVSHNSNYGIYLDSSTRVRVIDNESSFNAKGYQRAASGIRVYRSPANTISSNVSHHNEDSGIELYTDAADNLVVDNITYANGDHGIDNLSATGQRIIGNSVHDNVTAGINLEGGSTGATLANNISVDNGIDSPRTKSNIRVDSSSVPGTAMDHDLVDIDPPFVLIEWDGVLYGSLAAFSLATGQEAHGIQADPRWIAPADGNFHLAPGSPAIDSADSGAPGATDVDGEGTPRVDDPSVANTGAGPRSFDDRGALEAPPTDLPPAATLTVTPNGGPTPLLVTADASGSSDPGPTPIATYAFDFGDGTTSGPSPSATADHTYTTPGTYTVVVTVTDSAGMSSTASAQVTATPAADSPPNAVLSVTPGAGSAPLEVIADASGSSDADASPIATYAFDFGDGSPGSGPQAAPTAAHTYTSTGTYTLTVTVTDTAGLSATASTQVGVTTGDAPPSPSLSVSPGSGVAPLDVTADGSQSTDVDETPIATYAFDFGDGSAVVGPGATATAQHRYATAGTFTITMTVTDSAGLSSTASTQVTVAAPNIPPSAALTVTPTSGLAPLQVTADASDSVDPDGTITSYAFDFGDGTSTGPQSAPTAAHTYTTPGSYMLAVTVTGNAGASTTATREVTVVADLVQNGGFETGLSGWNLAGGDAGTTLTQIDAGHSGGHAARLANGNASSATCTLNDAPNWVKTTSAGTYVASLWVRAESPGQTLRFRLREYTGSTLVGTQTQDVALTTGWRQVTLTYTVAAPGASTLDLNAYVVRSAPGVCFDADDASIYLDPTGEPPPPPSPPPLIANEGFETDLTGWNSSGGDSVVTLTRVSGGHSGDWSARLDNPSAAPATCTLNDSPNWVKTTEAGTYTGSAWVRADAGGQVLRLRLREYDGSTLVGSQTSEITLTTSWQRIAVALTVGAPGSSTLDLNGYVTKAAPGTCAYLDDVSLSTG